MASIEDRFWSKVDKTGDCWLWTAGTSSLCHYGYFWDGKSMVPAHRFAYGLLVGSVFGLQLDHRHTCPKHCVNPEHLRPVTHKQNQENRVGATARSTTGLRGVFWDKSRRRWRASVGHNGKVVHAGYFRTAEEAEAAVIAKRMGLYTHNDADRQE